MKKYTIDGVCYTQTPLVLGQMVQLSNELKTLDLDVVEDIQGFVTAAGDRLPRLLAIVLTPEGVAKKDKDLDDLANTLEDSIDLTTLEEVVEDFFTLNPVTSILQKIEKATGVIGETVGRVVLKMMSKTYASSLQEATSPSETQSSGDAAPLN